MFEAPAFAFALIAIGAVAQAADRIYGGAYGPIYALGIAQTMVAAIGYAELRARTSGSARVLATLACFGAAVMGAIVSVHDWNRGAIDVDAYLWILFVANAVGIAALVVAVARRHVVLALAMVVAQLVAHPPPPLFEWQYRAIDWTVLALAGWSVLALRVPLAWLATRDRRAPPRRRPFGPVATAAVVVAIAQLVPGAAIEIVAWCGFAIAAWRLARVVPAPLAITASGIAWFAASAAALDMFSYIDASTDRGAGALALVTIAIAARIRTRGFVAIAFAVGALAIGAMVLGDTLAPACVVVAALITAVTSLRAGRVIAALPQQPTVAEVFA
ncbi:MAG TPA: hypothetical protein VH143_05990 [Kofleriaceae bacterium]|jgi:hypothetical protein|nr:hypothetical protein [Kofleriaceae bacterium]